MGRTNPTFRRILTKMQEDWQDYRRALRHEDQQHFDQLFEDAENHADAAGYLNPDDPVKAVLFSMILAQQKRINALREQINVQD